MNFSDGFAEVFRRLLPSPFAIALILTLFTFALAGVLTYPRTEEQIPHIINLFQYWYQGFWDQSLMVFAMQMMLILVLGHVLALSNPINTLINFFVKRCSKTAYAATIVCLLTLLVSFFNWGLGLIFGAIFARKVAENAVINKYRINYPIIGAAGYSGLMVWHGGLSGSAPLKVAEQGHFLQAQLGVIPLTETIFSPMNIIVSVILLFTLPAAMYLMGKRARACIPDIEIQTKFSEFLPKPKGAEKIDNSKIFGRLTGSIIIVWVVYLMFIAPDKISLNIITPNFINMILLGLSIFFHNSLRDFISAVDNAISGASGILIQFPFYFGIMGIMKYSGLTELLSNLFISISNQDSFAVYTLISASIINIFIPSGGGQWAIQGPIIAEAALKSGVSPAKAVMALAYGDQLTNMLQPFWALPLLGITGLQAKEILPYSFILMLIGGVIFAAGLLLF